MENKAREQLLTKIMEMEKIEDELLAKLNMSQVL